MRQQQRVRSRQQALDGLAQRRVERQPRVRKRDVRAHDLQRLLGVSGFGRHDRLAHGGRQHPAHAVHRVGGKAHQAGGGDVAGEHRAAADRQPARSMRRPLTRTAPANGVRSRRVWSIPGRGAGRSGVAASGHVALGRGAQPLKTASASAKVNAFSYRALPMMTPTTLGASSFLTRRRSSSSAMPPERTISIVRGFGEVVQADEVGPAEHPVAGRVRVDHAADPVLGDDLAEADGAHLGALLPAVRGDHAVAAVETDDEALAEPVDGVVEQVQGRHRRRAHDHPVHADPGDQGETLGAADAAAVLHRHVDGVDDALDDLEVGQLAGARRVEVDHVQRLRTLLLPLARQRHRIVAEDGDVLEVSAAQADYLAALDTDGREHDHAGCASSSSRPAPRARRHTRLRVLDSTRLTLSPLATRETAPA